MIISHKYKFVFIGLPFSASSAITEDLHVKYKGEPYLRKHSLYQDFIKGAKKEEKDYFVFAVLRNPMEMVVSHYVKMKTNAKGNFTNSSLFKENGGHITKKHRSKFNFIQNHNATFQEYFLKFYTKPYDNLSSITLDNCDFVIRYENIREDYIAALKQVGIESPSKLPVVNKTIGKKADIQFYYTEEVKERAISVFGPFMKKFGYKFPDNWGLVRIRLRDQIYFKILRVVRNINELWIKKHSKRNSLPGTIYGNIQRTSKGFSVKQ